MPCYNPNLGLPVLGVRTPAGKQVYRFIPCDRGIPLRDDDRRRWLLYKEEYVPLPCNICIGCRLKYAREWATRCMFELQYHDFAWFVTLTYNDEHVPRSYYPDPDTGEAIPVMTLNRRDIQLFFKRLRKALPGQTIRYYGCAEYGPTTWRPHYHVILFGPPLPDLEIKRQNVDGTVPAWTSATLQAAWSERPFGNYSPILDSIGDVEVSEVNWQTCSYVARYVVKKQLGPDGRDFYAKFGLMRPYTYMSLKPAIGRQYLDDHPDIYDWDSVPLPCGDGVKDVYPPRYYDRIYDVDHPDELAAIKEMRRNAASAAQEVRLSRTSLSLYDLLALEERAKLRRQQREFDI